MMNTDIKKFMKMSAIIGLPYLLITAWYFVADPFMMVKEYDNYFTHKGNVRNIDYISTEMYKINFPKYQCNSFIFGSSRSQSFKAETWQQYIKDGHTFHFSASGETIYGIWRKVKYIDSLGHPIKNVLITVDASVFENTGNSKGILFMKHPEISGQSKLDFEMEFFKAWYTDFFWAQFMVFKISEPHFPFLYKAVDTRESKYVPEYNDIYFTFYDKLIAADSMAYYKKDVFYNRTGEERTTYPLIKDKSISMLKDMKNIFNKQGTRYYIIVNPLYNQRKLHPNDMIALKNILGADHIYDFSGVNNITNQVSNYYEESHYKPVVAEEMMRKIYGE